MFITLYNVTYTSLPVLVMAVLDQVEITGRLSAPTKHLSALFITTLSVFILFRSRNGLAATF